MSKKKVFLVLISGFLLLGTGQLNAQAAGSSPPGTYLPPTSASGKTNAPADKNSQSFKEILGDISDGLDDVEKYFSEGIGEVSSLVGQVKGIFQGFTSPVSSIFSDASELVNLVVRLVNFPSQVGGWWNVVLDTVTGELDPCLSEPSVGTTPPFVYEPGWCIGGGGGGDIFLPEEGDGDYLPHEGGNPAGHSGNWDSTPPAPYIGKKSVGVLLKESQGAAGIPDPSELRLKIRQAVDETSGGDLFETNPTVKEHYLGNTGERAMSRVAASLVLGSAGQQKLKAEQQGLQETVTRSFQTAGAAQGLNVTQDVIKQMVQMQAQESVLLGSVASSAQQGRIDSAINHLNLSNISRSLDEQNRARRIDRTLSAQKVLRTTSQLSLY